MNTVTLKELMDSALGYADFPRDSLDADQKKHLIKLINLGLQEVWEAIIDSHPDMVHKIASTISIVSGTEAYALPRDFYKATKVWLVESDRRYRVQKFNLEEVDGFPKPLSTGSIQLWYAPPFAPMKIEKASVPGLIPPGWEDYGALFAAVRLLDEEGGDSSKWTQNASALMNRIRNLPASRDSEPDTIGDYYGRYDTGCLREPVTRDLRYRIMGTDIYFIEVEQGGA